MKAIFMLCNLIILVISLFIPILVLAADLKISDSQGIATDLKNPRIVYGRPNPMFFNQSDVETQGIRILQGDARVTIEWDRLNTLTISNGKDNDLGAEIRLKDGQKKDVKLVQPAGLLYGDSDLGSFSIDLRMIKTIEVLNKEQSIK